MLILMSFFESRRLYFMEDLGLLQLLVSALTFDFSILEDQDSVCVLHVVQGVSYQYHCLRLQVLLDTDRKEESSHVSVHCAQQVVQDKNVGLAVECSREGHSGSLSSRESRSFLSHNRQVSVREHHQIRLEAGVFDSFHVPLFIVLAPEEDVVAYCVVGDPRVLSSVGDLSIDGYL